MPISNRIILTDVDGVLLEWENHFTKWMVTCGHKLKENFKSEYDMQKRFSDHNIDIKSKIREFNRSAWMGTQPPMP